VRVTPSNLALAAPFLFLPWIAAAQPPAAAPQAAPPQPGEWRLAGSDPAAYAMDVKGRATDAEGAAVAVRCVNAQSTGFGTASARVPADAYRQRRVTLAAEVQTAGANGGATIWLRVDAGSQTLLLENGMDQPLRGDTAWTRRAVSLPVSADATSLVFGVLIQPGGGTVTARNLRLEAGPALADGASGAPAAVKVLDAAIAIVKDNALRADTVDWAKVEPEVRAFAAGAERTSDVYPAIQMLLARLGDNHSFFMPPAATSEFKTGGAQNPPADVRSLPDGVGYIGVPTYRGADPGAGRAYATRAQEAIAAVRASAPCGWVVDLRANGGGNMWPMLAGLRPLVGDGVLGSFERRNGQSTKWTAADPHFDVSPAAALRALASAWVAVLTGPRTGSSGEFVTIAFRGRPRARSFGLPTAGLSTSNDMFPLPDGSTIVLTTSVGADRTGKRYGGKIEPDEAVGPGTLVWPGDDATLAAAVRWLKQSSGCGTEAR
jgi:carboxyl-terminal processing protease